MPSIERVLGLGVTEPDFSLDSRPRYD